MSQQVLVSYHDSTTRSSGHSAAARLPVGQKRPATIYRPSPRPYPESLPPIEYAGHLETRKVGQNGMMRWKNGLIFTSKTLRGEWVELEEIDDNIWSLYYGPVLLARFDEREMRFYG